MRPTGVDRAAIDERRGMQKLANRQRIEKLLDGIATDSRRGASELAGRVIAVFALAAPQTGVSARAYLGSLRTLARKVARCRPAMAPIGNVAARLFYDVRRAADGARDADAVHAIVRSVVRKLERELDETNLVVSSRFRRRFADRSHPVVISYSSQVIVALAGLRSRNLDVEVCESRPRYEGRRTARLLGEFARSVTLITEAQIALAMERADCVVLGSDAVHADGSVRNKAGSRLLALAARARRRPVIVLAGRYKLTDASDVRHEGHPAREVWASPPPAIRIQNEYFETVPAKLVSYIVMEDGVYRPGGLRGLWGDVRRYRRALKS